MNKSLVTVLIIIVVALGVAALIIYGGGNGSGKYSREVLDTFAQCLAAKKITMYGAYWCSNCKDQKVMFGSSFRYVPYVECTEEAAKCIAAKIEGYPTWMLPDGKQLLGQRPLETLAAASGCPLPEPKTK